MKLKITYLILLLTHLVCFGQTNVYHPYPQGWGASWHTESFVSGLPGGPNYSYGATEWGGDTVINSINYTKVYSGIGAGHQYMGGVRQNVAQEEAYFIDDQNVEHDISFDQHALVGDTVVTYILTQYEPDTNYVVFDIDSMIIDGSYRKEFILHPLNPQGNIVEATYLCGVGFINYWGFEWGVSLQCHSVDHNWLYGGPPNPFCILGSDDIPIEHSFHLFPNPTDGQITLNKEPQSVHVYDLHGNELDVSFSNNTLDLSDQTPGVYLGKFVFDNGVVTKRVIKN